MRHVSFHHAITSHDETPPLCLRGTGAGLKRKTRSRTTGPTRHHVPYEKRLKTRGSGRSSGKHAHVMTCTSPLERTSEPSKIRRPPRTRAWVARPSTCDAHRQRCTTPVFMETTDRHLCACRLLIGRSIHRRNGGRTPRVMDETSRKKPGRHAGRGTPATSLDSRTWTRVDFPAPHTS